jgi:hypothetical protein
VNIQTIKAINFQIHQIHFFQADETIQPPIFEESDIVFQTFEEIEEVISFHFFVWLSHKRPATAPQIIIQVTILSTFLTHESIFFHFQNISLFLNTNFQFY